MRVSPWDVLLLIACALGAGIIGRCSGEQDGAALADLRRLELENDSLARLQRVPDTMYVLQRDTFVVRRTRVDTMVRTVEQWKYDTTEVVRFVVQAESTIAACTQLVLSCDERVRLRDERLANRDRALAASEELRQRPWTSAGVVYDLSTGRGGVYVDRDVWRLRVGASISPGVNGLQAQLRAGVRW